MAAHPRSEATTVLFLGYVATLAVALLLLGPILGLLLIPLLSPISRRIPTQSGATVSELARTASDPSLTEDRRREVVAQVRVYSQAVAEKVALLGRGLAVGIASGMYTALLAGPSAYALHYILTLGLFIIVAVRSNSLLLWSLCGAPHFIVPMLL